jgi:hypothetical protein
MSVTLLVGDGAGYAFSTTGRDRHRRRTYPASPLLRRLAYGRPMAAVVRVVETVDEAADVLLG